MTLPALPVLGSTSWYPYAQGLDDERRTGRLSDAALRAAYVSRTALGPLYGYFSKLGLAKSTRCTAYIIGDSIAGGQGAATISARWLNQAQDLLRTQYTLTVTGGQHVPGSYTTGPVNDGTTFFPSWTLGGTTYPSNQGPGNLGIQLTAGATATITRTCTSADLYFQIPFGGPTGTVSVDGGTAQSLSLSTTAVTKWSSGALTRGSHTFVVTCTAGAMFNDGGYFYDGDETAGFNFWDGSRSGSTMSYHDTNDDWKNHLPILAPDLLILGCLTNDARSAAGGYSSANYATYLSSIVTKARTAVPNIPILFMTPYVALGTLIEPWSNYTAKITSQVAATLNSAFYDMSDAIPDLTSDPYGFLQDGVHPTSRGHALLAQLAGASALTPR